MAIEKLSEFAKDGSKETTDLNLDTGFAANRKPARQWFNWLFNSLTLKINEIIDRKVDSSDIIDNLTTDDATKPVSAKQAKILQDEKFAIANLVNDLTTGGIDKALTAEIGKVFFNMFSGGVNYFRIPNPLDINKPFILQFSQAQSNTTGDISFNFPIGFPNACLSVNASTIVLPSANSFYFTTQTNPPTKTNVTGKIFQNGSPANNTSSVIWAIGN